MRDISGQAGGVDGVSGVFIMDPRVGLVVFREQQGGGTYFISLTGDKLNASSTVYKARVKMGKKY
jgi:hypothetical protein